MSTPESAAFLKAAIDEQIRRDLRSKLMKTAERVVDEVVEELQGNLQTSLTHYREVHLWRDVAEIIVKDKRNVRL